MKYLKVLSCMPLVLLTSGCVGGLFYYPDRQVYQTPDQKNLRYEEVWLTSKDGTRLNGWFVPAVGKPVGTVIHFHGNAQNMTAHFSFVDWLPAKGFNVFTFDYRGYGKSEGSPERGGVYEDSVAALNYVRSRPDVDKEKLLILGQSLGGTNALAVVGRGNHSGVQAVAIDSTFYSYRSIVRDKIGDIPVLGWFKWPLSLVVIGNSYSAGAVVDHIAPIPLLLIHGTGDRIIPYHHGQQLYEKAKEPKQLWTLEGADHTAAFSPRFEKYKEKLVAFYTASLPK